MNFTRDAKVLNDTLLLRTFLTGKELSVADYICWAYIRDSKSWNSNEGEKMVNLTRWFNHVAQMEPIKNAELSAPKMTDKGAVKEVKVRGSRTDLAQDSFLVRVRYSEDHLIIGSINS